MKTVAVVTGASRGLGRGTARGLGQLGMMVYVTARDAQALAETAAEVTAAGGIGVAVPCDHADDVQVKALFDRIARDAGRLDLLINNAAAVHHDEIRRPGRFWEKGLKQADMITVGLRSDYVACYYAMPLMLRTNPSLIINISFYGARNYFVGPAYGAAKAGTDKMTFDMGVDLRDTPVSVVSLWPGFIRTEMFNMLPPEHMPPALAAMLPEFETPEFTARVAAALLRDPNLKQLSGQTLIGAELGVNYGILDLDGKRPKAWTERMGRPHTYTANPSPIEG